MSAKGRLRGPVGVITRACDSHRVLITDDTNSDARNPREVPRKPHPHRQIRASGPHPPTRRCCGGEIQFLDHAHACSLWSRLRTRHSCSGFANIAMCVAHQSNFPTACAAPRPVLSDLSKSGPRRTAAQGFGSAIASGRGMGGACGGGAWNTKIPNPHSRKQWNAETKTASASGVPRVESTRAKTTALRWSWGIRFPIFEGSDI
jgi:hypothetical protein